MALNMDAILRVTTKVGGTEQLTNLGTKFRGLESAAKRLTSVGGLLGGALGSLAPLASIGGLTALIGKSIEAGDKMHNLSMRTGVTVENLGKLNKAAKLSGTDIDTVSGALNRLSKAMVAAVSSSRFSEMTKEEADQAVRAVQESEREQTRIINDQADARIRALEEETDQHLKEINKRYRELEKVTNDRFDDQADAAERAAEKQTDAQLKQIDRFYESRRKAIQNDQTLTEQAKENYLRILQDQEDNARDIVRDRASEERKLRQREFRDKRTAADDYREEQKKLEEKPFIEAFEKKKKKEKELVEYQLKLLQDFSRQREEFYRNAAKPVDELSGLMDEMGLNGKKAAEIFARLGVSVLDAGGKMRNPYYVMIDLFNALNKTGESAQRTSDIMNTLGKGGTQMGEMINMGGTAIDNFKVKIDTAFANLADKYTDDLITLGGAVGGLGVDLTKVLLPVLQEITPYIIGFVKGFNDLPGPVKMAIGAIGVLAVSLSAIGLILGPLILLFTGPAGLVVAIVAGIAIIGTLAYTFRDKLGGLPAFLLQVIQNIVNPIGGLVKLISPLILSLFAVVFDLVKKGVGAIWGWLGGRFTDITGKIKALADGAVSILSGIAGAVRDAFMAVPNMLRTAINAALAWAGGAVNNIIGLINGVITGVNNLRLPGLPRFDQIPTVPIPQFATGAYVTGATTAMIGEGGQPEYVIPANRMAAASTAYLQGARGVGVVNGQASGGSRSITVNTGPILQQPDGSRWASLDDLERGIASAVDQAVGIVASPAGRMALGGA